jgi:hypothetical protein
MSYPQLIAQPATRRQAVEALTRVLATLTAVTQRVEDEHGHVELVPDPDCEHERTRRRIRCIESLGK